MPDDRLDPTTPLTTTCGVLGPITVGIDDVPVSNVRQRRLLVALLLGDAGGVSLDLLAERVWDDDRPEDPVAALRVYVHRLRDRLPNRDAVVTSSGRYRLAADALLTDADEFERLLAIETGADDLGARARTLRAALDLWRGEAFGDLAVLPWVQPEVTRLEELRWSARERLLAVRSDLGEHAAVAADASRLLDEAPDREGLRRVHLLALYRHGRQAEALAAYDTHRDRLVEELGLDPGPELQRLQEQILVQDPGLAAPDGAGRPLRGYRLAERIGAGPVSVVHRAAQPAVGRDVAIKVIGEELADDPVFVRRFNVDARIAAQLAHPHVVPVHDYWREPGRAYVVTRLLRGGSLASVLDEGPWHPARVARLAEQVGGALAFIHRHGVIHRDVTPGNVLLDVDGAAYLADVGVATGAHLRRTASEGGRHGEPSTRYVAPEQRDGGTAGETADVFSFAVVLVTMLAGRPPTSRGDAADVAAALGDVEVPDDVRAALLRATTVDPATRTPSVAELVAALQPVAGGVAATALPIDSAENPYRGLAAFDVADAAVFHGRSGVVDDLVRHLANRGVLAVVGPSGSGKSSVVHAGLLPALAAEALPGSGAWFVARMVPGDEPLTALEQALDSVRTTGTRTSSGPTDAADGLLAAAHAICGDDGVLLLVIDQFEELWGPEVDPSDRERLLDLLVAALEQDVVDVRIVLTIRADRYDRPLAHPGLAAQLRSAALALGPMSADELAAAIVRPAALAGVEVEPALVAALVDEAGRASGALPLLQYTLTELFDRRSGRVLRLVDHREIGGLAGALSARAEDLVAELPDAERDAVRALLLRLVQVTEDHTRSRRRIALTDLRAIDGVTDELIGQLRASRLVTTDRDPRTREPTLEVAHESLFTAWPRLRQWLDEAERSLVDRKAVSDAALAWLADDREPGGLLRGARLERAEELLAEHGELFDDAEQQLVAASIAARDDRERRAAAQGEADRLAAARLRRAVRVVSVVASLAVLGALLAAWQWRRAEENAELAAEQTATAQFNNLVTSALFEVEERPDVGLRLAIAAHGADSGPAGQRALLGTLTRVEGRTALLDAGAFRAGAAQPDCPVGDVVGDTFVTMAPVPGVGAEVVAVDPSSGAVERDTTPLECGVVRLDDGTMAGALPSPATDSLGGAPAIARPDGTLVQLDDRIEFFFGPGPLPTTVLARLVDGSLATVDLRTGQVRRVHDVRVLDAMVAPDGRTAAVVLEDGARAVVRLATGALSPLPGGAVAGGPPAVWAPDASSVTALTADGVAVWDVDGSLVARSSPASLRQVGTVVAIRVAPDDGGLAVLGTSGVVVLDHPALADRTGMIRVRQPAVDLRWLPDGGLAVLGADGVVEVVDLDGDAFERRLGPYPAGSTVSVIAPDVGVWDGPDGSSEPVDLRTGRQISEWDEVLPGPQLWLLDADRAVAWSATDSTMRLLTSSGADVVEPISVTAVTGDLLQAATDGAIVRVLLGPTDGDGSATAVSLDLRDGTTTVTALQSHVGQDTRWRGGDVTAHWWRDPDRAVLQVVAWDGERLAPPLALDAGDQGVTVDTAAGLALFVRRDGDIVARELATGAVTATFEASADPTVVPVLLPGGRMLVRETSGDLVLWDRPTRSELGALATVPTGAALRQRPTRVPAVVSGDGRSVWFSRGTQFVSVLTEPGAWLELACSLAPTPLTAPERARLLPDPDRFLDVCP